MAPDDALLIQLFPPDMEKTVRQLQRSSHLLDLVSYAESEAGGGREG